MSSVDSTTHKYFQSGVTGNAKRKYPIIFHENYDIGFWGIEKIHPFDTHKWRRTHQLIMDHFKKNFSSLCPLKEVDESTLSIHYTLDYIKQMHNSNEIIAEVAEVPLLYWLPNFILRSKLLEPFKWHTSGTILASRQAMLHGSAVNLGGGFHHASKTESSGFCFFDDIGLAIQYLWKKINKDLKFFIIDLDAHQGNGHEMDKYLLAPSQREKILTLDMYNKDIFPNDRKAKTQINYKIEISSGMRNDTYLNKLMKTVKKNSKEIINFKPDLVIFNAGTDILEGDPLGGLKVNEEGILQRDEFIFKFSRDNDFPVLLLMSGGYQQTNANIVAKSIINLIEKGLINSIDDKNEVVMSPPKKKRKRNIKH